MFDLNGLRQKRARAAKRLAPICARLDRICARMNGGLAAVAIALAVVVCVVAALRAPVILAQKFDPQAAEAGDD